MFKAGEYDHIFDVELGDGIMRKLPFNNGANFLEAADKFCSREHLSRVNVEQIVQFLRTNAKPFKTRDFDGTDALKAEKLQTQKQMPKTIPHRIHLFFDAQNVAGPKKKILEFNEELKKITDMVQFEMLCKVLGDTTTF